MLDTRLNENGIYNKNILSEALDVEKKLDSAIRSLKRLEENKYTITGPKYSDMPRGGNFENFSNYELAEEKESEIIMLEKKLDIAKEHVGDRIANLSLPDDKKNLLRKCFVDLLTKEQAFIVCNMSVSDGYRKYRTLLNEIVL